VNAHLLAGPILLPLAAAALQLLLGERRRGAASALGALSCLGLLGFALALLAVVGDGTTLVYRIGGWPARFGIVLVADRLSALMLLLTAVLALALLPVVLGRWRRPGSALQPLAQFLLMGLNGTFLTGDLFNLFVFFEVLLAASYGLALHHPSAQRVGAGLHYIAINLLASLLFLVGVSLIFGVTGTLNMAALAQLVPQVPANTRALLHAGAAILGVAFLVKAAMWPLGFWLPRSYAAAPSAVAAMFAVMTKVGVYVLLRLSLLLFGAGAGAASAGFGSGWLLWGGAATVATGVAGMLGARELSRLAGYNVLVSSGSLLGAIGVGQPAVIAGALAYLVVSTLAVAAFFLLAGLIAPRDDAEEAPLLEAYDPGGLALYADEDESQPTQPAPVRLLAGGFFIAALLLAGLPPLSGFLAKFALLAPLVGAGAEAMMLFALIVAGGLGTVVAMCRVGIQVFWEDDWVFPPIHNGAVASVAILLGLCLLLTVLGEAPMRYLQATAAQLHWPDGYIRAVLP